MSHRPIVLGEPSRPGGWAFAALGISLLAVALAVVAVYAVVQAETAIGTLQQEVSHQQSQLSGPWRCDLSSPLICKPVRP